MPRSNVLRFARDIGHISWWVFVVATLFAGGINWWQGHSVFAASFSHDGGWTMYAPLSANGSGFFNGQWQPAYDHWWQSPGVYGLIAFVIVVSAAIVDAFAAGRLIAGTVTVAVPFVALGLFVLATPGTIDGYQLRTVLSMLLVLTAVAVREVWMRAGAPALKVPATS